MSDLVKDLNEWSETLDCGLHTPNELMAEAAILIEQLQKERDALVAALALAKQMFHDYEMEVDCPAPTKHRHKMDKMYAALAKHDADVARKAFIDGANWGQFNSRRFVIDSSMLPKAANEYVERIKDNKP